MQQQHQEQHSTGDTNEEKRRNVQTIILGEREKMVIKF